MIPGSRDTDVTERDVMESPFSRIPFFCIPFFFVFRFFLYSVFFVFRFFCISFFCIPFFLYSVFSVFRFLRIPFSPYSVFSVFRFLCEPEFFQKKSLHPFRTQAYGELYFDLIESVFNEFFSVNCFSPSPHVFNCCFYIRYSPGRRGLSAVCGSRSGSVKSEKISDDAFVMEEQFECVLTRNCHGCLTRQKSFRRASDCRFRQSRKICQW